METGESAKQKSSSSYRLAQNSLWRLATIAQSFKCFRSTPEATLKQARSEWLWGGSIRGVRRRTANPFLHKTFVEQSTNGPLQEAGPTKNAYYGIKI